MLGLGRNHDMLRRTASCKLLMGKIGLSECRCSCTSELLKIYIFLDSKHTHITSVGDTASFHGGWVKNSPNLPRVLDFSAYSNVFLHTFSYFQLSVVNTTLAKTALDEGIVSITKTLLGPWKEVPWTYAPTNWYTFLSIILLHSPSVCSQVVITFANESPFH
jgi:hypothetical protein